MPVISEIATECTHCGEKCLGNFPVYEDHTFCCEGCKAVWSILSSHGLSDYYNIEPLAGNSFKSINNDDFEHLDNPDVIDGLVTFSSGVQDTVFILLPTIHCTACVWLLERMQLLHKGILHSQVNFLEKKATIVFNRDLISLRELAFLLQKIGYPPVFNTYDQVDNIQPQKDNSLIYKIGVAGFCFGNIMLLSFPDYLGTSGMRFSQFFGYLKVILSLPIVLYAGNDYFNSVWHSLKLKKIGIEMPIVIGMLTLFFRSLYELLWIGGEGYLDSLAGFILFLLIGRWLQNRTFEGISFDRDFKSFFPLAVKVRIEDEWKSQPIDTIEVGDKIMIRHGEITPCDGYIYKGSGSVDYSFVTGESRPVFVAENESICAGGRVLNTALEVLVTKQVHQGQLTQLWNNDIFNKRDQERENKLLNFIGKYFTIIIIAISILTFMYWSYVDTTDVHDNSAFDNFTAVLIIACPCVLALSVPFIYGNGLRFLSQIAIFCRNVFTILDLNDIDTIVFDKTGTLTDTENTKAQYKGSPLNNEDKTMIKSLAFCSNHKLSKSIVRFFCDLPLLGIKEYEEIPGRGLQGIINGKMIRIGSAQLILDSDVEINEQSSFVEIDGKLKGHFVFENQLRTGIPTIIERLQEDYRLAILSGDQSDQKAMLREIFPKDTPMLFSQNPTEKQNYIKMLQDQGQSVLMIGDGLNDSGAIKKSNVGIVVSSKENNFTPASDIIVSADNLLKLPELFEYAKWLKRSLYGAFVLAFLYNGIGLFFAVQGHLTPIVAAILMPISSLSIMLYGVLTSWVLAKILFKTDSDQTVYDYNHFSL